MSRPDHDQDHDDLAVALEALATGRDDLVPAEVRARIEADPALREVLGHERALAIDIGLALRDVPMPEVDLDALVDRALRAAPPPALRASARELWSAGVVGLAATLALGVAALGRLPTLSDALDVGDTAWSTLAAVDGLILGRLGNGMALLLLGTAVLLGLPLRALMRRVGPLLVGLIMMTSVAEPAQAQHFEGTWEVDPTVSVSAQSRPASEVLQQACESAGLGFVSHLTNDPLVTVQVRDGSLRQVIAAVVPEEARVIRQGSLIIVRPGDSPSEGNLSAPTQPLEPHGLPQNGLPPHGLPPHGLPPRGDASSNTQPSEAPHASVPALRPAAAEDAGDATRAPRRVQTERVTFGREVRVGEHEAVEAVVTMGGDAVIEGEVTGDVATMGGDVTVHGLVRGDVITMGGDIELRDGGRILGEMITMGGDVEHDGVETSSQEDDALQAEDEDGVLVRAMGSAARHGVLFLLGLLLIGAFPDRKATMARALLERPLHAVAAGFLGALATGVLCIACAITLIGIPIAALLVMTAVIASFGGLAVVASVIGAAVPWPRIQRRPVAQLGVGVGVMWLISMVPWVGALCLVVLGAAGYGAVILTRFGRTS